MSPLARILFAGSAFLLVTAANAQQAGTPIQVFNPNSGVVASGAVTATHCAQFVDAQHVQDSGGVCGTGTGNASFGTTSGNVANDVLTMSNTTVGVQDSGTALSALAPLASPTFTGTINGLGTGTSSPDWSQVANNCTDAFNSWTTNYANRGNITGPQLGTLNTPMASSGANGTGWWMDGNGFYYLNIYGETRMELNNAGFTFGHCQVPPNMYTAYYHAWHETAPISLGTFGHQAYANSTDGLTTFARYAAVATNIGVGTEAGYNKFDVANGAGGLVTTLESGFACKNVATNDTDCNRLLVPLYSGNTNESLDTSGNFYSSQISSGQLVVSGGSGVQTGIAAVNGDCLIGNATPLWVAGSCPLPTGGTFTTQVEFANGSAAAPGLSTSDGNSGLYRSNGNALSFATNGAAAGIMDAGQRLVWGNLAQVQMGSSGDQIQELGTGAAAASLGIGRFSTSTGAVSRVVLYKSHQTGIAALGGLVGSTESLGEIDAFGDDNSTAGGAQATQIISTACNTISAGIVPGCVYIGTVNGSGSLLQRFEFDSNGTLCLANSLGSVCAGSPSFSVTNTGVMRAAATTLSGTLAMGGNTISGVLNTISNSTNGYEGVNGNCSSTAPTLAGDKAANTGGLGCHTTGSGNPSLIAAGTEVAWASSSSFNIIPATVNLPGLASTSVAQTGTVCWNSTAGLLTVDATAACLASLEELKNKRGYIDSGKALSELMNLKPFWFTWKHDAPEWKDDKAEQPGLGAHQVESVDKRLVAFGKDGKLRGVRYQEMTAFLVSAIQEQQKEIVELRGEVATLKRVHH